MTPSHHSGSGLAVSIHHVGGGAEFDTKRQITNLETAGCTAVRVLPRQVPAPLEYVMGQRAGSVTR